MQFKNRLFALVGNFKNGDKNLMVRQMIEMAGGTVKDSPTISKQVAYVVIGGNGYPQRERVTGAPEEQVAERQKAGQDITLISEEFLFAELKKEGITKETWLKDYSKRHEEERSNIKSEVDSVNWTYNKNFKELRIEDAILPDFLGMIEDAEIVGYINRNENVIKPTLFEDLSENNTSDDFGSATTREYGPSDLRKMLPWQEYAEDIVHLVAPNLIEVPPALFAWTKSLKTAELPAVRIVANGAFYECRSLESIHMPEVLFIGNGAFAQCNSLQGRLDCGKLEYIGPIAFSGCQKLKVLFTAKPQRKRADGKTIQGTGYALKAIGEGEFLNCKALKNVAFDKQAAMVDKNAFHNCPLLNETKTENPS